MAVRGPKASESKRRNEVMNVMNVKNVKKNVPSRTEHVQ